MLFTKYKVVDVIDGVSFKVAPKWFQYNRTGDVVRLSGHKAPAMNEPGGMVARSRLQSLINGKSVRLEAKNVDMSGVLEADVYLEDRNIANSL